MITKISKVTFNKSGAGSKSARVTIPADWVKSLEIDAEHRELEIELTANKEIIIRKKI